MPISDPVERQEYQRRYQKNYRKQKRERFNELRAAVKASGCVRCPEKDVRCLDLHHKDPTGKEFNVSHALHKGVSEAKLVAELMKCEVLCANCHRKEHAG